MLIEPRIGCPRAACALAQIGWANKPIGTTWINIHKAGTAARSAAGRAKETKKIASPGRIVQETTATPAAGRPGNERLHDRPIEPKDGRRSDNEGCENEKRVRHIHSRSRESMFLSASHSRSAGSGSVA
jgi:hypothetical protein